NATEKAKALIDPLSQDELNQQDASGQTALHKAAASGNKDIVDALLDAGADKTLQDNNGKTAGDLAEEAGHKDLKDLLGGKKATLADLIGAIEVNATEKAKALIDQLSQDELNQQDASGQTALHKAAAEGNKEIVEALIQGGAEVDVKDSKGKTPADLAKENGYKEVVDFIGSEVLGVGLGWDGRFPKNDFYYFDPSKGAWTKLTYFPGEKRQHAVALAVGGKVYVGLGSGDRNKNYNDFYCYDPSTNNWTELTNFPGGARSKAVACAVGGKVYVGLGFGEGGFKNDFYCYDPSTGRWTELTNFPGKGRSEAVACAVGGKVYVGLGREGGSRRKDFYCYDPSTGLWTELTNFPEVGRTDAVAFAAGAKFYVGLGWDDEQGARGDFYCYDPSTGTWEQLAFTANTFPGVGRYSAVACAVGGKVYVGLGSGGGRSGNYNNFYYFDPSTGLWTELEDFPEGRIGTVAFSLRLPREGIRTK
ncbi:MAG: ankyrin repeat domain-containing protein, partial [Cytophagales bacterium]|nr:ankyrin repeat domain-containing protein [Cytophagales bacterium]